MELNERLQNWKQAPSLPPREEKIRETIDVCIRREPLMSYREFLWGQLHYTRKRWWALQGALLLLAARILPDMEPDFLRVRSIGVIGCLFAVFLIPELWRNRESKSTQVEAACFYSLRQVYSARITLFALVDVALLTLFSCSLRELSLSPLEILAQFLLPATVTACICFSLLCGKQNWSETATVTACLTWCALWWLILMNEPLYKQILPPVWIGIFAVALGFLILAVRRCLRTTNQYWEVDFLGTTTG